MALLNAQIGRAQGALSAGARAASTVAQLAGPAFAQDVQNVLSVGRTAQQLLGTAQSIASAGSLAGRLGALSGGLAALGSGGDVTDVPTRMLGGLSLRQAEAMYQRAQSISRARKNLFFLRVWDHNPPMGAYQQQAATGGGLFASKIGPSLGSVVNGARSAVAGAVNVASTALGSALGGGALGGMAANALSGAARGALGGLMGANGGASIAGLAASSFDLLAVDVSYGLSIISDHQQLGGSYIDRPIGRSPTELQVTTFDDEAGTLKRWFEGKIEQVAHSDGTMGIPADYVLTIEIVHAVPSDEVAGYSAAYVKTATLRAESVQVELSRRDQALMEHAFTFKSFDHFMGII